jgi:hypothetical protein
VAEWITVPPSAGAEPGQAGGVSGRRARNGRAGGGAERSRARPLAIVLAALLVVAAAVLIVKSVGGSSSSNNAASTPASTPSHSQPAHHAKPQAKAPAKSSAAGNPGETVVDVLNATSTTGLAHRTAGELQKSGYSQATALAGRPSGANPSTVVQYASGHQADAQAVAHAMSVNQVHPEESSIGALAPGASVVVIVGADRASAGAGEESAGGGATAVP